MYDPESLKKLTDNFYKTPGVRTGEIMAGYAAVQRVNDHMRATEQAAQETANYQAAMYHEQCRQNRIQNLMAAGNSAEDIQKLFDLEDQAAWLEQKIADKAAAERAAVVGALFKKIFVVVFLFILLWVKSNFWWGLAASGALTAYLIYQSHCDADAEARYASPAA